MKECQTCVQDKRIDNSHITPELLIIPEWDLGPDNVMKVDLLTELPPSGGYENIITPNDILSRLVFAYPVSSFTAVDKVKVVIDIFTSHAYLPTVTITDKRSIFVSNVIQEIADVLGITLRHTTTKHAKTIAVLERTHARIKTSLKMS